MATLQCVRPQTASTIDILKETDVGTANGNIACSHLSRFPKCHRRFTKFEVILLVLLALMVVAFIVMVVLLTSLAKTDGPRSESTAESIQSLAQILSNMDSSVDPCENFYQYACGGWLRKTHIEDSDVGVFTFNQVQKDNRRRLKEILENEMFRSNYSTNPFILKVFDMYSSCMNITATEKFGDLELQALFSKIGVFNFTKSVKSVGVYRWDEVVVKVKRILGLDVFFTLDVMDDLRNSSKRRIVMRAIQLGLDNQTYSSQNLKFTQIRQYYHEYMTDLMELATSNNRSLVKQDMAHVLDLESRIAKTQLPPDQRSNFQLIYNLIPITTLTNMTSKVDWLMFFRNLTFGAGYMLKENENLIITSPRMIREIVTILSGTNSSIISNYIAWTIVRNLVGILPKKYGFAHRKYLSNVINTDFYMQKWDKCIEATSNALPIATAFLFAEHVLPRDRLNESLKIISYLKEALLKIIPLQFWMDKKSRAGAIEKAKAVIFDVGYPGDMTLASLLKQISPNFVVSKSNYFTTNINVKSSEFMKEFKSLKTSAKRRKFENFADSLTPTAAYYFTRNKVGLSIAFLRNPFYYGESYRSLNFGALGMAVGHELTHGFDSRGFMFDKNGFQLPWMSDESKGNLRGKIICLSRQYSQFKYKGKNVNGNGSVRESFSDTGGLKLAFEAYKLWQRHNSDEPVVAEVKLTNHQLFFLSFAQMWCAKYKDIEAMRMISSGPYLPSEFRVRGSTMNSRDFADAFSCPAGSAMNPKDKCEVW